MRPGRRLAGASRPHQAPHAISRHDMPAENDGRHRFFSGGHPDMPESWDGGSRLTRRAGAANHGGTGGQQQDRGHGERHRRGTRLAQAARLGGIHLAVQARLDRRLLRVGLLAINLHQSLPGGLQRGKRVSHLGGSRVLVGGDLLRSVEGGLKLVRAGLVIRLGGACRPPRSPRSEPSCRRT